MFDALCRWDVIRVTILAFFGSLEVFLELCPKAIYQGRWFHGRFEPTVGLCSILRVPDIRNSHIPMWFPICWCTDYSVVLFRVASLCVMVMKIAFLLGTSFGAVFYMFSATCMVSGYCNSGGQAWFYKGFNLLVIGLALTLSLSAISSWFVVPFSALVLLAPFLDMDCLMDSYLLIQEGFYMERFFNETDFVDILCRDSHVDLMGNLVLLLMILEIGHRCDDFEYMVLL
ncbi:hypothetical protein Tco_0158642 [Tanacetum coccineum]